ncbi:hypothetical protein ABB37_04647 [Leptomonas pyrrhocoris]|uniref:Uncharacterized protein n=1 Tax=Leptomonas pyrrhocoris TaxID=157538 RepID=A0A0M9G1M4_LEPPY|nr:hypothetical protein ABB37_04647 [Leptomonas pyrrhocoris]KPA80403.1 hypothetical protein ABB37_04647 [Leptomonas pyrrhocoris]|eukprot:XP_015658842.1 hypothetical protein ABB37_04647 [Leptomonas pyrrhocoris]
MLASPEEAYTDYLEHVVTEAGVDPVVVRATLRQLDYDDATIAVIMGEASGTAALSSSSSSTSTLTESSPSVQYSATRPRDAASGSASSVRSGMSHPLVSDARFTQPPSITHESKPPSRAPTSASSLSALGSTASAKKRDESAVLTVGVEDKAGDEADMTSVSRGSEAEPLISSAPTVNLEGDAQADATACSPHAVLRSSWGASAPFELSSLHTQLTSRERDVLSRWMREYRALLLSSAMPRQVSNARADALAKIVPLEEPFDECHPVLHTEASSESSAYESGRGERFSRGCEENGRPPRRSRHADDHRSPKGLGDDSGVSAASSTSSGGFSSDGNIFSSSSLSSSSRGRARVSRRNKDVFPRRSDSPFVHRENNNGCWRRHASSHSGAAPPDAFRHVVPKAKSALFVPTRGVRSPDRSVACVQCTSTERDCRHPYREAQDVRIIRASQSLAGETGRARSSDGVSRSRARQLDMARQTQHTSRAEPANGRRIPVMQAPVRLAVHPRSGLAGGRQTTMLPTFARTDRVALALYYRREWEKQGRRTTVAWRDAA